MHISYKVSYMEAQVVNVRLIYKLCTDERVVNRPVTMGSTSDSLFVSCGF